MPPQTAEDEIFCRHSSTLLTESQEFSPSTIEESANVLHTTCSSVRQKKPPCVPQKFADDRCL